MQGCMYKKGDKLKTYSSKYKKVDVVQSLLKAGANVNAQTEKTKFTPLHWACLGTKNTQIIKMLLKEGASPYVENYMEMIPLDIVGFSAPSKRKAEVILLMKM